MHSYNMKDFQNAIVWSYSRVVQKSSLKETQV